MAMVTRVNEGTTTKTSTRNVKFITSQSNSKFFPKLFLFLVFVIIARSAKFVAASPIGNTKATDDLIPWILYGQGRILGNYAQTAWTKQKFMQFRGIPFAEPPSGNLRFKVPIARQPWSDVLNATQYGRRCPVSTTIASLTSEQLEEDLEDCLNLCVYTKDLSAKRPVMVYVHGGGFYNGTSSDHPPHYLMEKDIVLITIQYRLNAFGYISTFTDEIPGNAAVADVLLALQWVQDHVGEFGGDPQQITVFGQSAGAALIGTLLVSPKTPVGLFRRAILQSGSVLAPWATLATPLEQSRRICNNLQCANCENLEKLNHCLMSTNVTEMLKATAKEEISPIIGDVNGLMPQMPGKLLESENFNVSLMSGFTKHDGSFGLSVYYDEIVDWSNITVRHFADLMSGFVNDTTGLTNNLEMRFLFPKRILDTNDHATALPGYFDLNSIHVFKSPITTMATHVLRKNLGKTFMYTFDYADGEHTRFGYENGNEHYPFNGGVHHSDDNIYLFATHSLNERDTKMARKMVELWTSFAIDGVPRTDDTDDQVAIQVPHMENEGGPYFHINEVVTFGDEVLDEFTAAIDDPNNKNLLRPQKAFL